ncbi:hypothetical protein BGZ76_007280 [Entomortierella beljakovae]|nr:hypothetical protein BGZ76_007280 [Entomortierella beljakovae]
MSIENQAISPASQRSAGDIYNILSTSPFEVEIEFSSQASSTTTEKERRVFNLNTDDRQNVLISALAEDAGPVSLSHLNVKSSVTHLPSSRGSIRTIEISIDPTASSTVAADPITLHSFSCSLNIPLEEKAILANGYQSWSTSFAGADESTVFAKPNWFYNELTHLALASDMHIYDYPSVKGRIHSNLFTVIRDKCFDVTCPEPKTNLAMNQGDLKDQKLSPEEIVLCGSLSEDSGFTYFLMDVNKNKFTIMQDCEGKQLKTLKDKVVLRTFFAWGSNEPLVWDSYSSVWESFHPDRRSIKSSLHNQLSGWTSWYYHYENINEHVILENLNSFSGSAHSPSGYPAKVFQIDDGFTIVGDWLDCDREKFPRGMAVIAEAIRDKGLLPGLWLAPFLASKKANIVKDHPDWFLPKHLTKAVPEKPHKQTRQQNFCCCCVNFGSSSPELMLAHPAFFVGAYALDLENPNVRSHLANVFRTVTQEWGFKILKLDFLFAAALVARNGKTRGQLMWESMQMVRDWVGPDTILLGCGVPLGACFKLVDYCRIGCDVGASWDTMQRYFHDREYISCFNSLTSTLSRWALSGRFFGNDPDVFFIRDWKMGLNPTERRTLMLLNHLLGHLVFCSDPLDFSRLNHEQKQILSSFFPWASTPDIPTASHEIKRVLQPLASQKDIYMIQVQAGDKSKRTYIVATNLSSRQQHVHLSTLERMIDKETIRDTLPSGSASDGSAVYFQAEIGQFGLASAAYTLKPRETCVFLRVVDSNGLLCGLLPTLVNPGYASIATSDSRTTVDDIQILATSNGHVLPSTEIQSFERHVKHRSQLKVTFRPTLNPKTIKVWLAWRSPKKNKHGSMDKISEAVEAITLNDQDVQYHPEMFIGSGIFLASCILSIQQ